jgi:hypothetical protein
MSEFIVRLKVFDLLVPVFSATPASLRINQRNCSIRVGSCISGTISSLPVPEDI